MYPLLFNNLVGSEGGWKRSGRSERYTGILFKIKKKEEIIVE